MKKKYLTVRGTIDQRSTGRSLSLDPTQIESVEECGVGCMIVMMSGKVHLVMESLLEVEEYVNCLLLDVEEQIHGPGHF